MLKIYTTPNIPFLLNNYLKLPKLASFVNELQNNDSAVKLERFLLTFPNLKDKKVKTIIYIFFL